MTAPLTLPGIKDETIRLSRSQLMNMPAGQLSLILTRPLYPFAQTADVSFAGNCDWAAGDASGVRVRWSWERNEITRQVEPVPGTFWTNAMVVSRHGKEFGAKRTARIFLRAIARAFLWQREADMVISSRRRVHAQKQAQWEADCTAEMSNLASENDVFMRLVFLAGFLGYKKVAYAFESPIPLVDPDIAIFTNYAPDWAKNYVGGAPTRNADPRESGNKRTNLERDDGSKSTRWQRHDFDNEARANGIQLSWVHEVDGTHGTKAKVAFSEGPAAETRELVLKREFLVAAACAEMSRFLVPKLIKYSNVKLTSLDKTILLWTLDGKTIGVIADILKVKESSAKYHAQQVQAKFGCPLHLAAVIALRLKLLD